MTRSQLQRPAMFSRLALTIFLSWAALGVASGQNESGQTMPASEQKAYSGMVTCSKCGAKHSMALAKNATNCALACVHSGAGFALVVDEKIYVLEGDPVSLKKLVGQRAQVVGVQHGNTITVSSAGPES